MCHNEVLISKYLCASFTVSLREFTTFVMETALYDKHNKHHLALNIISDQLK